MFEQKEGENMDRIITSGITSDSLILTDSDTLTITSGGTVNNTKANAGCAINVSSGGIANITFINDATFKVSSGGLASQTMLNGTEETGGIMHVYSGGFADTVMVNAYTELHIHSGGSACDVIWTPCVGHLYIDDGADVAIFSDYHGVCYGNGISQISSAAAMVRQTVAPGQEMFVFSNGAVSRTIVSSDAFVQVTDGTADNTTIYAGGALMLFSGAVANNTANYGGAVEVSAGAVLNGTTVTENGAVKVFSGGIANNTVANGAALEVSSGAVASGITIRGEGGLYADSYAKLTGRMILSDEALVILEHGANIDFNISALTTGAPVRINNFQLIDGWDNVAYTITVSGTQANGTYSLASGFSGEGYEQPISVVNTDGEVLQSFFLGETKDIGGTECTLKVEDGTLIFRKGKEEELPERPPVDDDGTNDWLYVKKTKTLNDELFNSAPAALSSETAEVQPDEGQGIAYEENETVFHNNVGADDEVDYRKISLEKGAILSFSLIATDAAKFVICSLTPGKVTKGVQAYTQKAIQTTTLKKGKDTGMYYTADTKPILLAPGEYYVSMQSTAKKNGNAYYNIVIDQEASVFFEKGDNSDDWTDMKEKGNKSGLVGDVGKLASDTTEILTDWVGYGDAIDYKAFTIDSDAMLSFSLTATDKTKFTIWKLSSKTSKKGVTTWSLTSVQAATLSMPKGAASYSAVTKTVILDAGTYYFSMQSTNAAKGGNADYTVSLNPSGTFFFTHAQENIENDWLYDKKQKILNPNIDNFSMTEITDTNSKTIMLDGNQDISVKVGDVTYQNFAGYGDAADYATIVVNADAKLSFKVTSTDQGKFTVWKVTEKTDKKGNLTYTVKSLQETALKAPKDSFVYSCTTKSLALSAGEYYVSFQSTNASKGGIAYYNVELNLPGCSGIPEGESVSAALYTGPDAIAAQDDLILAGYASDALASAVSALGGVQADVFLKDAAFLA